MGKLSADLRRLVETPDDNQPVLVTVLCEAGAPAPAALEHTAAVRPVGSLRHLNGEVRPVNLLKLASEPGVISIFSASTFQPALMKSDDEDAEPIQSQRRARAIRQMALERGKRAAMETTRPTAVQPVPFMRPLNTAAKSPSEKPSPDRQLMSPFSADIHNVHEAWSNGWTGDGVKLAVVDTGVDFCNPDLQGRQARVMGGAYDGWPLSYDPLSAYRYMANTAATIGPDTYWDLNNLTYFTHTLPVEGTLTCINGECSGDLKVDFGSDVGWPWPPVVLNFTWPNKSKSGQYRYSVHPDYDLFYIARYWSLGYAKSEVVPPVIILSDETTAGVYDTVYVDINCDRSFLDEKPMRRGDELAGRDLTTADYYWGTDGVWDLSAGMLAWISDGANLPPGLTTVYEPPLPAAPAAGQLLVFIVDTDSHGTNCSSMVAGTGVMEDPYQKGPINPLFAGAAMAGGNGGPVVRGMSPDATVAAFPLGLTLPLDAWRVCAFGFDGEPNSGDEVQIVSNSWGGSEVIEDGWDPVSRYAAELNLYVSDKIAFLSSTGNGGHGYGTATRPGGGSIISVGASTLFGELFTFENVDPARFLWGDVIPFSNRGPGLSGGIGPHVVAVGSFGTAAYPLNLYGNGQAAYNEFGGTSMSCPITAGVLAMVHEAFHATHGRWPTWEESRDLLMQGAMDLYHDVLSQGAGQIDAGRSTSMAADDEFRVVPGEWLAGEFRGEEFAGFPAVLNPGQAISKSFTITNPTAQPVDVQIEAVELFRTGQTTHTFSSPGGTPVTGFTTPTLLLNITDEIIARNPDLVRAQFSFDIGAFDPEEDYGYNMRWRILFYDWTDLNHDGKLFDDANMNNQVDAGEIHLDPATGLHEYNRFTYGYPTGTLIEASVGRESLARRHDGVFLGFQRRTGTEAATLNGRIAYFSYQPWSWVGLNHTALSVPAGGSAAFEATLTIPPDNLPGNYEGALRIKSGGAHRVIPIMTHVAPQATAFSFGAENLSAAYEDRLPDNKHVFGGFDWTWRYESGDWRVVYFDVPDAAATPGRHLLVDVDFAFDKSDVDVFLFGPDPDDKTAARFPSFFGPYGARQLGGSSDTYLGSGIFKRFTNTGMSRELISGAVEQGGLHFVVLHHDLFGGDSFGEPVVGQVWSATIQPKPVFGYGASGSAAVTFTSDADIPEGLAVEAYGLTQPDVMSGLPIEQDNPSNYCDAPSQAIPINISHCGVLELTTTSASGNDIDLFLVQDDGDSVFECGGEDVTVASSTTATADEFVRVVKPADGQYWAIIQGYDVAGAGQTCTLIVRALQGTGLTIPVPPAGAVSAGVPVPFNVEWSGLAGAGMWEGMILLGPGYAPAALEVPVMVWIGDPTDGWLLR